MGNDSSRLKGLVIDKNAVEANDFWALYNAEKPASNDDGKQLLSIFQGEPVVTGQLWVAQGPMERAIKNFMIYRHPYILKYVATWEQGGQKHLATERVRPLIAEVATLSDIEVCLGLRTVLCSLIFLVEKAQARHLNICISSINIAVDGSWRLAGFEYVWKSKEVTKKLLDLASAYRYKASVDPNEMKENNSDCIEQYAFASLCEEILSKCRHTDTATPYVQEFRDYCVTHLKHKNAQMRPKLSAVLLHPYFNHEFVLIHSFLIELPLKSVSQKQEFFTSLIDRLRSFNEDIVGAQLAELLLSRMVLLDPTAQLCVTPYVLKTKNDHSAALFSNQTYTRYLIPHIKKNFRVRDAQIRLILLEYFMEFVRLLPKDELESFILPHLQAGMKDTNDILVAKTMRCLADLIPILGSTLVVGGDRERLFSDGRPQAALPDSTSYWVEPRSITPVMGNSVVEYMVSGSPLPENGELGGSFNSLVQGDLIINNDQSSGMPPRLSPDGGEDDKTSVVADGILLNEPTEESANLSENITESLEGTDLIVGTMEPDDDDDEAWSDWETDELQRLNNKSPNELNTEKNTVNETHINSLPSHSSEILSTNSSSKTNTTLPSQVSLTDSFRTIQSATSTTSLKAANKIQNLDDLSCLDIIVQKTATPSANHSDEFDFFKDMEPVIETKKNSVDLSISTTVGQNVTTNQNLLADEEEEIKIDSSRFAAVSNESTAAAVAEADGWGVDAEDVDWDAA